MSYRRITMTVTGAEADSLADALLAAGALSVDLADADADTPLESPAFDEPGQSTARWPRCRVSVLFPESADVDTVVQKAHADAGVSEVSPYALDHVNEQDWVRVTRDQFKPIRISNRLWIVPSWLDAPDAAAINIRLDPGLAFGTGSHPTTRLCLQWLDANLQRGARVLDYGCGSGILAIAALRLGAAEAVGVDIDPQALVAARDNAMQNAVAANFQEPGARLGVGYDVVLANILANPLIALAPLLAAKTLPQGHIVLSGILSEQAADVAAAYAPCYDVATASLLEGWALLVGRRRFRVAP